MVVGRNSSGVGETDGVGFDDLADGLLEGDGEVPVRGRWGGFVPSSWFLVLCSLFLGMLVPLLHAAAGLHPKPLGN